MNPEWLRYYIAAKLNASVEDIDFNPDDFVARVNSDLVGKYVNIASRARASSPSTSTASCARTTLPALRRCCNARYRDIRAGALRRREFGKALREVMALADRSQSNTSTSNKPWELAKKDPATDAQAARTSARRRINAFRLLTVLSQAGAAATSGATSSDFLDSRSADAGAMPARCCPARIKAYKHLMTRIEPKQLDALFEIERKHRK